MSSDVPDPSIFEEHFDPPATPVTTRRVEPGPAVPAAETAAETAVNAAPKPGMGLLGKAFHGFNGIMAAIMLYQILREASHDLGYDWLGARSRQNKVLGDDMAFAMDHDIGNKLNRFNEEKVLPKRIASLGKYTDFKPGMGVSEALAEQDMGQFLQNRAAKFQQLSSPQQPQTSLAEMAGKMGLPF